MDLKAGDGPIDFETECFFIAPIGAEGSEVRGRSDGVMECIVAPAAQALGLYAVRADQIAQTGDLTDQIVEHVLRARASVVDLTGANPNVFYEMGMRHAARLPTVLIARQGETLPSDVAQLRTIFFDDRNLNSVAACRDRVTLFMLRSLASLVGERSIDRPAGASRARAPQPVAGCAAFGCEGRRRRGPTTVRSVVP